MEFKNTEVFNFEGAFRGLRNPLQSHDRSDSYWDENNFILGEKDLELARKLAAAGTEHRKYLRQILVSVDITGPLYWWKEFDTYKVGTVANSTSTMHKLLTKSIDIGMFEIDFTNIPEGANGAVIIRIWIDTLDELERLRLASLKYKETNSELSKYYWKELVRLLPSSWLQTRTVTMNYENLLSMYYQRRRHKLTEWHQFCEWIETLPYTQILFGIG